MILAVMVPLGIGLAILRYARGKFSPKNANSSIIQNGIGKTVNFPMNWIPSFFPGLAMRVMFSEFQAIREHTELIRTDLNDKIHNHSGAVKSLGPRAIIEDPIEVGQTSINNLTEIKVLFPVVGTRGMGEIEAVASLDESQELPIRYQKLVLKLENGLEIDLNKGPEGTSGGKIYGNVVEAEYTEKN
eukprot:CAMPEP_0171451854 /NCGR_PEP_ID=MMETSP0945-20130129/190_1 /TAXON_ID=109269 /ORGANISM="Vaucheria litorea, Strain CCMP2940" /LENGTH=186 /DNA_ID=CAMNT_0011976393 /DNA_START=328 /DNA_END=885 /DNA_ORIENTATION=-